MKKIGFFPPKYAVFTGYNIKIKKKSIFLKKRLAFLKQMWYSIRAKIRTRNDFSGGAFFKVPGK